MKRTAFIIFLMAFTLLSCRPDGIIGREDMSDIYYDFYMADRYLNATNQNTLGDSVHIYIPIIEKHGYTFEEYQQTVNYYLHKPEELTKIFKLTEIKLKDRREYLENAIAYQKNQKKRWKLLDSLEVYGDGETNGNGYYRALRLLFFKPDTLEVTSPVIDSVILRHITSAYFLYDSLPHLYNKIEIPGHSEIEAHKDSVEKRSAIKITDKKPLKKEHAVIKESEEEEIHERRSNERLKRFSQTRDND